MTEQPREFLKVWLTEDGEFAIWIDNRFREPRDWGWILGNIVKAATAEYDKMGNASHDEIFNQMQRGLMECLDQGIMWTIKGTKNETTD